LGYLDIGILGYWDIGYWILDAGHLMLDAGCWTLDAKPYEKRNIHSPGPAPSPSERARPDFSGAGVR